MEGKGYRTTGILLLALSLWVFVYLVVGTFLYLGSPDSASDYILGSLAWPRF